MIHLHIVSKFQNFISDIGTYLPFSFAILSMRASETLPTLYYQNRFSFSVKWSKREILGSFFVDFVKFQSTNWYSNAEKQWKLLDGIRISGLSANSDLLWDSHSRSQSPLPPFPDRTIWFHKHWENKIICKLQLFFVTPKVLELEVKASHMLIRKSSLTLKQGV